MSEEKLCGQCVHYHPVLVPTGNGNTKDTGQAHCLAKSTYAKNRVGKPVYPPGAKVEDLPHARHQIVIVRREQKEPNCMHYTKKGGHK